MILKELMYLNVGRLSACLFLFAATSVNAYATSQCYQWQGVVGTSKPPGGSFVTRYTDWMENIDAVRTAMVDLCNQYGSCHTWCPTSAPGKCLTYGPVNVTISWPVVTSAQMSVVLDNGQTGASGVAIPFRVNPAGCKVYVSATPPPERGNSCNGVGDPIDPASCRMYATETDMAGTGGAIEFKRFYNSKGLDGTNSTTADWRFSFSRSLRSQHSSSTHQPYVPSADNSSLYTTEAAACTSGFAEVRSRVTNWANVTSSYSNGVCTLSAGAVSIGRLPILYTSRPTPQPGTTVLIGVDAIRDDGQIVKFALNAGSFVAPGVPFTLQQTVSGFELKTNSDSIEAYDVNGKLLSITSRDGVIHAMGYDALGRLSTVTNSFGRQVTLNYDSNGRLSTVTRP